MTTPEVRFQIIAMIDSFRTSVFAEQMLFGMGVCRPVILAERSHSLESHPHPHQAIKYLKTQTLHSRLALRSLAHMLRYFVALVITHPHITHPILRLFTSAFSATHQMI